MEVGQTLQKNSVTQVNPGAPTKKQLTSIPLCILLPILRGFREGAPGGTLSPIVFQTLHVHQPQGLGTLSQVVCQMWWTLPSSPKMKTLSSPLNMLWVMECTTGAWLVTGAPYPVSSQETQSVGPVECCSQKEYFKWNKKTYNKYMSCKNFKLICFHIMQILYVYSIVIDLFYRK